MTAGKKMRKWKFWHVALFPVFLSCVWRFADYTRNAINVRNSRWLEIDGLFECNIHTINAEHISLEQIAGLVDDAAPVLFKHVVSTWDIFKLWRDRNQFVRHYGHIRVGVGVGFRISTRPNRDGLLYSWIRPDANAIKKENAIAHQLRQRFEKEAHDGTTPSLTIAELLMYVRNNSLPYDTYTFTSVDDTPIAEHVLELHRLWNMIEHKGDDAGTFWGFGGKDTGIMFHEHKAALSAVLVGHKRWFIYDDKMHAPTNAFVMQRLREAKKRDSAFEFNSMQSWVKSVLPLPKMQQWWKRVGWDCVQEPGDILYIPGALHHATLNLDETVSVSVQGSV